MQVKADLAWDGEQVKDGDTLLYEEPYGLTSKRYALVKVIRTTKTQILVAMPPHGEKRKKFRRKDGRPVSGTYGREGGRLWLFTEAAEETWRQWQMAQQRLALVRRIRRLAQNLYITEETFEMAQQIANDLASIMEANDD